MDRVSVDKFKAKLEHTVDIYSNADEAGKKCSIYKVPAFLTDGNNKPYWPQVVSFGPYHHGKIHLELMEEHKYRALRHFLRRCGKPVKFFINSLGEVVQDLIESYEPLDPSWKDDRSKFLELMILDGCFMLELVRTMNNIHSDYADDDPIFSCRGQINMMHRISRDMLLLENQLPLKVLHRLIAVENNELPEMEDREEFVNRLIVEYCCIPTTSTKSLGKCMHVLDVCRKSLLIIEEVEPRQNSRESKSRGVLIPCATKIKEAGIQLKQSKSRSLKDISFIGGVLELPIMCVDDATKFFFLNLMAFECLHVRASNEVTSYIFFMNSMIHNKRDVQLLRSRGIVINAFGNDKQVTNLLDSLARDISLDPESGLDVVIGAVTDYCNKPWNKWRASLTKTYLKNPWVAVSLFAAICLFGKPFKANKRV